ncbi:hypothetical protein Bbelb_277390 [Branchiostoma belcheri]|nr:hypothetical protein Bbelb_277390 [Branchiostoma belcheri]
MLANSTLRDITKQPPLTTKIQSVRRRLLGRNALAEPPLESAVLLRELPPPHGPVLEDEHDAPGVTNWSSPSGLHLNTGWEAARDESSWTSICQGATLPEEACGLE